MRTYKKLLEEKEYCEVVIPLQHTYVPDDHKTCRMYDFPVLLSGHGTLKLIYTHCSIVVRELLLFLILLVLITRGSIMYLCLLNAVSNRSPKSRRDS